VFFQIRWMVLDRGRGRNLKCRARIGSDRAGDDSSLIVDGCKLASMETRAFRIKLKPNTLSRVREWASEIMRRKHEALETMRDESVLLECFFLEQTQNGDYLIGIMTAENFEQSQAAVRESRHDIDAYHQQFKRDTWESGEPLELLIDLNRIQEVSDEALK
jgi:hypothetical protein